MKRMAIRILMQSPLYFRQKLEHRHGCVKHLVRLMKKTAFTIESGTWKK